MIVWSTYSLSPPTIKTPHSAADNKPFLLMISFANCGSGR